MAWAVLADSHYGLLWVRRIVNRMIRVQVIVWRLFTSMKLRAVQKPRLICWSLIQCKGVGAPVLRLWMRRLFVSVHRLCHFLATPKPLIYLGVTWVLMWCWSAPVNF